MALKMGERLYYGAEAMLLHLPAVVWAVLLALNGWICLLTRLENRLRMAAGQGGYEDGFIECF